MFNGTGVALAGQSFDSGGKSQTVLYFQHWTGQIRQTQFLDDGTWSGGGLSEIVAVDAKNATPISMVSYSANGTNTVRTLCSQSFTIPISLPVDIVAHVLHW